MIDYKIEYIYNIVLSVFIGIIIVIFINNIYEKPIVPIIYKK